MLTQKNLETNYVTLRNSWKELSNDFWIKAGNLPLTRQQRVRQTEEIASVIFFVTRPDLCLHVVIINTLDTSDENVAMDIASGPD